jgi:hypothetical protein
MDFNATIDLIIRDLDEAREIIDDLKKYPGVPVLQVELAKSKCKTAGEVIALLKTIKYNIITEEKIAQVNTQPVKKEVTVRQETVSLKPAAENLKPSGDSPGPLIKKDEPHQQAKKPAESKIIADTFSQLPGSLNEQIGSRKTNGNIPRILKTKPLSSLMEAIGVNDRFLFISEIFNNNKDAYSQAISRLDKSESICDARAIIMSYTGDNIENEAVIQLLDLVKRKFPSDE